MIDKPTTIDSALEVARSGKFKVHSRQTADFGEKIPDEAVRRYEEDAWLLVRNVTIDMLDEYYVMVQFEGVDEEDLTADELLRYVASGAKSDYPLEIEFIEFTC